MAADIYRHFAGAGSRHQFYVYPEYGKSHKDDYEQILALCGENNAYLQEKVNVLGTAVFGSLSSSDQYSGGAAMGLFQSVISLLLVMGANHILVKRDHPGLW